MGRRTNKEKTSKSEKSTVNNSSKFGEYCSVHQIIGAIPTNRSIFAYGIVAGIRSFFSHRKEKGLLSQDIEVFIAGGEEYDKIIKEANQKLSKRLARNKK